MTYLLPSEMVKLIEDNALGDMIFSRLTNYRFNLAMVHVYHKTFSLQLENKKHEADLIIWCNKYHFKWIYNK